MPGTFIERSLEGNALPGISNPFAFVSTTGGRNAADSVGGTPYGRSVGRWLSLGIPGAEPTGLEQDTNDPNRFILNIQHPDSGNDALWEIRVN